jgi:hypothetical protein
VQARPQVCGWALESCVCQAGRCCCCCSVRCEAAVAATPAEVPISQHPCRGCPCCYCCCLGLVCACGRSVGSSSCAQHVRVGQRAVAVDAAVNSPRPSVCGTICAACCCCCWAQPCPPGVAVAAGSSVAGRRLLLLQARAEAPLLLQGLRLRLLGCSAAAASGRAGVLLLAVCAAAALISCCCWCEVAVRE